MCISHNNRVIQVAPGWTVHCCGICPDAQIWDENYRRQEPAESLYFSLLLQWLDNLAVPWHLFTYYTIRTPCLKKNLKKSYCFDKCFYSSIEETAGASNNLTCMFKFQRETPLIPIKPGQELHILSIMLSLHSHYRVISRMHIRVPLLDQCGLMWWIVRLVHENVSGVTKFHSLEKALQYSFNFWRKHCNAFTDQRFFDSLNTLLHLVRLDSGLAPI